MMRGHAAIEPKSVIVARTDCSRLPRRNGKISVAMTVAMTGLGLISALFAGLKRREANKEGDFFVPLVVFLRKTLVWK